MRQTLPLSGALALLIALPACVPVTNGSGGGPDLQGTCGAAGYQDLVGRDRSVAEEVRTVQPKRVYGPDEAVTMDYNPDRLNFVIDENGAIAEVRCG